MKELENYIREEQKRSLELANDYEAIHHIQLAERKYAKFWAYNDILTKMKELKLI